MNSKKQSQVNFTSYMTLPQLIISVLWIGVHVYLLPKAISMFPIAYTMNDAQLNLLWYAVSTVGIVAVCFTFLRRDFDVLADNTLQIVLTVMRCYLIIIAFDLVLTGIIELVISVTGNSFDIANENNETIMDISKDNYGMVKASAVFLAPIVEELMFRGAVFGGIRRKNRVLAYIVAMLAFSAYHVWSYAIEDPTYWVYMLQYLPISFLLCWCYEKCNCIWGSIAFHMTWNAITLEVLTLI